MNSVVFANIVRFFFLLMLQALVLKRIPLVYENLSYANVIIYPIFIMLLPLRISHSLLILLGFIMGISLDMFYNSPGVHASAAVFTAFIRPWVIKSLEPRGGYGVDDIPTMHKFGLNWFFLYASILLIAHLAFYFSVETFIFAYIFEIFYKTIFSFIISIALIMIHQFLLRPKV